MYVKTTRNIGYCTKNFCKVIWKVKYQLKTGFTYYLVKYNTL